MFETSSCMEDMNYGQILWQYTLSYFVEIVKLYLERTQAKEIKFKMQQGIYGYYKNVHGMSSENVLGALYRQSPIGINDTIFGKVFPDREILNHF